MVRKIENIRTKPSYHLFKIKVMVRKYTQIRICEVIIMIQLEDKQFNVLLNFFYSQFFCEGLENTIKDEEVSVVTTFRGMEYFLKLVEEQNIEFPYKTIQEYIIQNYEDGENIYVKLCERYEEELTFYSKKEKTFEELFGNIEFR